MSKLLLVGDRLEYGISKMRDAFMKKDEKYVLDIAKKQLDADVNYLNIRVGSYPEDAALMAWIVKLIQTEFDNVPLFLNSDNKRVIEAGLKVYDRSKNLPVINSADAGKRKDFLDLAAEYESQIVCICMKNEVPMDEQERINYCTTMLETGMAKGLSPDNMYFDAVAVSIKDNQEKVPEVLKAIEDINHLGLKTIIGVSNVSKGLTTELKPFVEGAFTNMALERGLNAAFVNPLSTMLLINIYAGENVLNQRLYSKTEFDKTFNSLEHRILKDVEDRILSDIKETNKIESI